MDDSGLGRRGCISGPAVSAGSTRIVKQLVILSWRSVEMGVSRSTKMSFDANLLISSSRIFAHESGHAIIATLEAIEYRGIACNKDEPQFSTLACLPRPPEELSERDYSFLAAGVAAERIYCERRHEDEGGDDDRAYFNQPNAPDFETTVAAVCKILSARKATIGFIVSALKTKLKEVNFDCDRLPEIHVDGTRYALVLTDTELRDAVANH